MTTTGLLTVAGLTLAALTTSAQIIVNETFDAYASTAEMQVNWGAAGAGTFEGATGNPGGSAYHPGGAVNSWIGSTFSLLPTAGQPIVLTADIFDDGTSSNERLTVGLRNGANPLFEMGHYNSTSEHYHVRVLSFGGNEGWVPLSSGLRASSGQPAGWNRFEATFTDAGVTVTLDLGADGLIDGTFISSGPASANSFTDLRFGGPSNLSSGGGGAYFDNLSLVVVPEPSVMTLGAAGLLGLVLLTLQRRWRR